MKEQYCNTMNKYLRSNSVELNTLTQMCSEFLADEYPKIADKMISFLVQNPQLLLVTIPKVFSYIYRKYEINTVSRNNQIILYY